MNPSLGHREGHKPPGHGQFLVTRPRDGLWLKLLLGLAAGTILGAASSTLLPTDRTVFEKLGYVAGCALFGVMCAMMAYSRYADSHVLVGVDGVVVGRRFIAYADILGVREEWHYRAAGADEISAWSEADVWTIVLDLRRGKALEVGWLVHERAGAYRGVAERQNDRGARLVRAIEAGRAAWLAGDGEAESFHDGLIVRGERTVSEWVGALRGLGAAQASSYRNLPLDLEALSRVLAHPLARPSRRAAAAVVLAAAGDESAAPRLRIAAGEVVHPRRRIALEKAADEVKSAAVVEALAALEELERDMRTSAMGRSDTTRLSRGG